MMESLVYMYRLQPLARYKLQVLFVMNHVKGYNKFVFGKMC